MSTRGMIGIQVNDILLGTYNHFDSYPDGLGKDMAQFCRTHLQTNEQREDFIAKALALTILENKKGPDGNLMGFPTPTQEDID